MNIYPGTYLGQNWLYQGLIPTYLGNIIIKTNSFIFRFFFGQIRSYLVQNWLSRINPDIFMKNPVIFKTNSFIFRKNQIVFRTYPVRFRTNLIIFRTKPVVPRTNPANVETNPVMCGTNQQALKECRCQAHKFFKLAFHRGFKLILMPFPCLYSVLKYFCQCLKLCTQTFAKKNSEYWHTSHHFTKNCLSQSKYHY